MRRTGAHAAVVMFSLVALLAGCGSRGGSSGKAATAAPIASATPVAFRDLHRSEVTGVTTSFATGRFDRVARNDPEWDALWTEHQHVGPIVARPNVDLSRETVVGVFLGPQGSSGWSVEVVGVAELSSHTVEVQYSVTRPTGQPTGTPVNPCHLVAVNRAGPQVTFVTRDVTQAAATFPLNDAHGQLVLAPTRAGGQTLAFLEDGQATPRELTDPSALAVAGAGEGTALLVSGDVEQNPLGATTLPEALRVVSFTIDDVAVTGALEARVGGTVLVDREGALYEPIGPLAAALLARPAGRPLRVTGKVDPAHRPVVAGAVGLQVTSHRETTTIGLRVAGGLAGADRALDVDDLPVSGAFRFHDRLLINAAAERRGAGRLAEVDRAALERLVVAADLRSQPRLFRPSFTIYDAPTTSLVLDDAQGQVTTTILAGASLPAEVQALVTALQTAGNGVATFRTLERGTFSGVARASAVVARDQASLQALWAAHAGTGVGATPPTVDFSRQRVVGVFQGRQPSGGYDIQVTSMERRGDALHLRVVRRTPAPGQPVTLALTSPYHIVVIDHQGATGDVYVDGVKQP